MQRCARAPHRDTVTELRVLTAQAACNAISSPIQQLLALCSMGREVPDCLVSSFTWKVSSSYPHPLLGAQLWELRPPSGFHPFNGTGTGNCKLSQLRPALVKHGSIRNICSLILCWKWETSDCIFVISLIWMPVVLFLNTSRQLNNLIEYYRKKNGFMQMWLPA